MKIFGSIILTLFLIQSLYSQNTSNTNTEADAAVKSFTWDIVKTNKGSLMFLDVPYQRDNSDSIEYLTLTVAKNKTKQRPEYISIIVPNNIVQSNGLFIKFSKTVIKDGEKSIELEKKKPVRIINGYTEATGSKEDIFQKFLDFDYVLFLYIYPDGSHKTVIVPLFSFKRQYLL